MGICKDCLRIGIDRNYLKKLKNELRVSSAPGSDYMSGLSAREYSPLALAFLGDAVYGLLARRYLIEQANRPAGELHQMSVALVCAQTQAAGAAAIADLLSEEETAAFKRGRNAKVSHTPKGASDAQYHAATGLESLFGWLSVSGRQDRAQELFDAIIERVDPLEKD